MSHENMNFQNRIKKELSEGIVRAILDDAGYRVIGTGIEILIRELICLGKKEYNELAYPKAMRNLPDFVVMDREQKIRYLVEVKYRMGWDLSLIKSIEDQVRTYRDLILVYLNGSPKISTDTTPTPSTYLRCCRLRINQETDVYEIEVMPQGDKILNWIPVDRLNERHGQWWGLSKLQDIFTEIGSRFEEKTLISAINSLQGILTERDESHTDNSGNIG